MGQVPVGQAVLLTLSKDAFVCICVLGITKEQLNKFDDFNIYTALRSAFLEIRKNNIRSFLNIRKNNSHFSHSSQPKGIIKRVYLPLFPYFFSNFSPDPENYSQYCRIAAWQSLKAYKKSVDSPALLNLNASQNSPSSPLSLQNLSASLLISEREVNDPPIWSEDKEKLFLVNFIIRNGLGIFFLLSFLLPFFLLPFLLLPFFLPSPLPPLSSPLPPSSFPFFLPHPIAPPFSLFLYVCRSKMNNKGRRIEERGIASVKELKWIFEWIAGDSDYSLPVAKALVASLQNRYIYPLLLLSSYSPFPSLPSPLPMLMPYDDTNDF